jgi:hypothetical protein
VPTLAGLEAGANARLLTISAGLDAAACARRGDLPPGTQTLLLLSPHEPAFWPAFQATPEARDGRPDPMDRWSSRVITDWAEEIGATPLFPFGGPPYHPFIAWALASGRVHSSPLGMIVHPMAGLFLSFRGALALPVACDTPAVCPHPCNNCPDQPCRDACPVGAFASGSYDVPLCKDYLRSEEGNDCMSKGCAARRACPIGRTYGRLETHSAFHMSYFL